MKKISIFFILVFMGAMQFTAIAQATADEREQFIASAKESNARCISCHGHKKFTITDEAGNTVLRKLYQELFIDTVAYYSSNHYAFGCTDCHSAEYETFPHALALKFEVKPGCMDCHEGDEAVKQFKFERINEEFLNSMHSSRHSEDFSCWSCHSPHYYKINAREVNKTIASTVQYDNAMCLSCHGNTQKYQLMRDSIMPNVISSHDWLPNQVSHFQSVRCIECHANLSDSVLVQHEIMSKDKAIRGCKECHSRDSRLTHSLYRFQRKELRNLGFANSALTDGQFVIGATRNIVVDIAFAIILVLVFTGIGIHSYFRKKIKTHHE